MKIAIYPGSFDPPTLGHLDIITRAAGIFDELIVACMLNKRKQTLFSSAERVEMLKLITNAIPNVKVDSSDELLADYAKKHGAAVIVKGLRAMSDFEMEFQMALLNRKMNPNLDTLFLTAGEKFHYLSSGAVKEIGALGGDISDFISPAILKKVEDVLCPV
ncbi:MAG: pantetheine-phosphate adenylyltransferase [Oscillospiraceae bacterium]|nr:pantetheine-phosphate adenylyltransferase [Oscillospiraceae bacterium]